jgi:hypothetical protein
VHATKFVNIKNFMEVIDEFANTHIGLYDEDDYKQMNEEEI